MIILIFVPRVDGLCACACRLRTVSLVLHCLQAMRTAFFVAVSGSARDVRKKRLFECMSLWLRLGCDLCGGLPRRQICACGRLGLIGASFGGTGQNTRQGTSLEATREASQGAASRLSGDKFPPFVACFRRVRIAQPPCGFAFAMKQQAAAGPDSPAGG